MYQPSQGHVQQGHTHKDPYVPDWEEAKIHGKAANVGYYDELSTNVCHCCNQHIDKTEIPICDTTKSLEFLGFGFPLFYMFIRNCILLLILMICVSNILALVEATNELQCGENVRPSLEKLEDKASYKCRSLFVQWANIEMNKDSEAFMVASFIAHLLALLYIKEKIVDAWKYYDERQSDLSDYAVMVNVGSDNLQSIRQRITDCVRQQVTNENGRPLNIHEIILIPPSNKVYDLDHEHEHAIEHYLHSRNGGHHTEHSLSEIKEIEEKLQHEVSFAKTGLNNDTLSCQNAIILFETEPEKEYFLEQINLKREQVKKYFNYPQNPVEFFQAPQPREIIYQNLQEQDDLVKNILIGWGLSFAFLAFVVLVFYFLQLGKNAILESIEQSGEEQQGFKFRFPFFAYVLSYGLLFLIILFNKFIMGAVLHHFTHMERHYNKAHEDFSFAFKYTVGMFLTTAFMTVIVEALQANNYYKDEFGVIAEETIMFIFSALIIPLNWLINPYRLCHNCEREEHYGKADVTQHEANHLMAEYHYDMGKRYAQILEMMWFAFLYADLIPIGAFFIAFGLCIYYWIDKYNLLRRASLQGNISADLVLRCLTLLDLTLFWRYIGDIVFDGGIKGGVRPLSIVFLIISIIYVLIPWNDIIVSFKDDEFKLNDKTFTEEKARFAQQHYQIYHPVYKHMKSKHHHGDEHKHIPALEQNPSPSHGLPVPNYIPATNLPAPQLPTGNQYPGGGINRNPPSFNYPSPQQNPRPYLSSNYSPQGRYPQMSVAPAQNAHFSYQARP